MHDIILMKCATDRLKDIDDVRSIIQTTRINWSLIVNEAKNQLSLGRERAILDLGSFLEKLKKMKLDIPDKVLNELWTLLEKQMKKKKTESKNLNQSPKVSKQLKNIKIKRRIP